MKKTLTIMALLAGAVTGYSQGVIGFTAGGPSSTLKQVIYGYNSANSEVSVTYNGYTVLEQQGATTAAPENPTGTTVYAGSLLTGTAYDGELLGVAGTASSYNQLSPILNQASGAVVFNFYTAGAPSGTLSGSATVVVPGTGSTGTPTATIAIAAWANNGSDGAATTLAAAQSDGYAWGISQLETIATATGPNAPATMPLVPFSFSLGEATPEPSTIALGVLGASALLFRRRK